MSINVAECWWTELELEVSYKENRAILLLYLRVSKDTAKLQSQKRRYECL